MQLTSLQARDAGATYHTDNWVDKLAAALRALPPERRMEAGKLLDAWAASGGEAVYRPALEACLGSGG